MGKSLWNQIVCGSCENLEDYPDESIHLTVTSPPYWNAIDYNIHAEGKDEPYRKRTYEENFPEYHDYIRWLGNIFETIHRKTIPGGYAAIVIGTVLMNRKHYPVPFDCVHQLTEHGSWLFHQDIIWHKVTGGVKRAGVFIQKPYPGYFYPNIMTEYILIFRKEGDPIFRNQPKNGENALEKMPIDDLFKLELANSVWHIAPVPPKNLDHPCPFPEEIPFRLIQLYSQPGNIILDPFCGTGQTCKIAHALGRQYLGFEVLKKYSDYATQRVESPLGLRTHQLIARFEKLETPPFKDQRENLK